MLVFFEGIVMCFILVMYRIVGIRDGAVGLVCLYEKDVQERVVKLGLVTKEQIKKQFLVSSIILFIPVKVLVRKWIGTVVVYPLIALLMAKIMTYIL